MDKKRKLYSLPLRHKVNNLREIVYTFYLFGMSERGYRLDVCPECKVREGIASRKRVYQCSYCGRWFCKRHLDPRLVNIPDFKRIIKDVSWQNLIEKEWRKKDAHPDFQYTKERWQELRFEKELTWAKIEAFLNGSRGYGKPIPSPTTSQSLDIGTKRAKTRKPFPVKKVIGLFLAVMIIGALLWYAPTIISYIQNLSSQPTDSSDESSYTNMTLRDLPLNRVNNTIVQFGDTEYSFRNLMGYLMVYAPFQSKQYIPTEGKTFNDLGIEIKVSKRGSDYISNYIVILVKPTVQNYMASLYYTKVNITLYETKAVNISSGLINKTNQYWFTYTQVTHPTFSEPKLTIRTTSQSKEYVIYGWTAIREFEIQTRIYKIESGYMVIYVKPLY